MEYALTADHHRVHALDAEKGQEYYCPVCGNQVIPRQGEVNSWHFAHVTSCLLNLPKKRHSIFTIISLIVQRLAILSRHICCVKKSAFLPSGKSPMRRYRVTLATPFIWRRNSRSSFMARIFFTTSFTQMDVVSMTMK